MKNNMIILVFLGIVAVFFFLATDFGRRLFLDTLIRCLFCLICIYFINQFLIYFGMNLSVKINEITACVSAVFGLSGVAGLYLLQLFFTMA